MIASVGWMRPVGARVNVGLEGIGQDLEGLWDPGEADGGAKLLVGPSVRTRSAAGHWEAALTAGPAIHRASRPVPNLLDGAPAQGGHRFAVFASASWTPSLRH